MLLGSEVGKLTETFLMYDLLHSLMPTSAQKWYTRIIGIFFTLVVFSLIFDLAQSGYGPETWHKVFHVIVGVVVLKFGWNNEHWWKPFCIVNGAFFTFVALFGWVFPDFAGLDAFNRMDTILHSIVGISGLIIGFWRR